jgi:hypothetical protein
VGLAVVLGLPVGVTLVVADELIVPVELVESLPGWGCAAVRRAW